MNFFRRLLTVPGAFLLAALSLLTAPLWLALLGVVDALRRPPRAGLRLAAFASLYLHCEVAGLLGSFLLWALFGPWRGGDPERYQALNFGLQRWWATTLFRGSMAIYGVQLEADGQAEAEATPLLLLPRHTSMADTLLPSVLVSEPFGTRLRYVLKSELLWDPCLDVVGQRLPNCFVDRFSEDSEREVAAVAGLAAKLGEGEGVLIYPEGTRFTPEKRARVLASLRAQGRQDLAERAERLAHLLPPRLGGTLALIQASPGVDVVFCAHTGFEGTATLGDLWSGALVGRRVRVHFWRVAAADVPREREACAAWLTSQWERMDAWLTQNDVKSPH